MPRAPSRAPLAAVVLAAGKARATARRFTVTARLGSPTAGIVSAPFLHRNFQTVSYTITVAVGRGTLRYEQDTVLRIAGRAGRFHHRDRNVLRRVAGPVPNPAARAER